MANIITHQAYNHFASTYIAQDNAQVDKHKKSDLQNVYKSIAKINKESPLYLLSQDGNAQAEAVGIKEHARTLRAQIESLNDADDSMLQQKSAYSSDPEAVSVTYIGGSSVKTPSFHIGVDALAQGQVNAGRDMADAPVGLNQASYSFGIRVNDQEFEFQYNIREGDTNRDVQNRLARLITKSGVGLSATVEERKDGRTALVISSSAEGKSNGFSVSDDNASLMKGTVRYFGLDHVSQPPTDAHFRLNGNEHFSESNRFTVGNEYDLTLKSTTPPGQDVTIGLRDDSETLIDNVRSLVTGYNDFLDCASEVHATGIKSTKLVTETRAIAERHLSNSNMEEMGIKINADGHISFDEGQLAKAAGVGSDPAGIRFLREFAGALVAKTKAISVDPMKYVERPVVNYKDPGSTQNPSPYVTSEYSGMMFNNYC